MKEHTISWRNTALENKFDHIIDYMEKHRIKSIVYISLIFTVFFALLIFLGYVNIFIPFIIIGILIGLVLVVGAATAIVLYLTD